MKPKKAQDPHLDDPAQTLRVWIANLKKYTRDNPTLQHHTGAVEAVVAILDGVVQAVVAGSGQGKPDDKFFMTFAFSPEQLETVNDALNRAAELSESTTRSRNMSLVCLDFVATNSFGSLGDEQKLRLIAKLEKLLGYHFIVGDRDTGEILYGLKALARIAALRTKKAAAAATTEASVEDDGTMEGQPDASPDPLEDSMTVEDDVAYALIQPYLGSTSPSLWARLLAESKVSTPGSG